MCEDCILSAWKCVLTSGKAVRMVDIQYMSFDCRNVCVRMVNVRYTSFDLWKSCVRPVDVRYAFTKFVSERCALLTNGIG